jgi:metal-responsive CopG/Arc/MetJ family transcriptional regulator
MEIISLKLEPKLLDEIDNKLSEHRYSTRTEFIRDAIREKLSDLEKEEILKIKGFSKIKTSDEKLHNAGERAFDLLEKKFKAK